MGWVVGEIIDIVPPQINDKLVIAVIVVVTVSPYSPTILHTQVSTATGVIRENSSPVHDRFGSNPARL